MRRVIRHEYERIPTASEVLSITSAVISGMAVELAELTVVGIGVAVPGQVRTVDGVVRNAPHLGWHDEAFGAPLAKLTGYRSRWPTMPPSEPWPSMSSGSDAATRT